MSERDDGQTGAGRESSPEKLRDLWEQHVRHEFATRDVEETLATMVEDAYVNHIPVLTGGVGRDALREFYSRRFIPQMPPASSSEFATNTTSRASVTPASTTCGLSSSIVTRFAASIPLSSMAPRP